MAQLTSDKATSTPNPLQHLTFTQGNNDDDDPAQDQTTTTATPIPIPRHVHFGTVTTRHYQQTLGDHPDCDSGPPITLDWDYQQDDEAPTVHELELNKEHRFVQRCAGATYLSDETRVEILLERGFTRAELRHATREVARIQRQRNYSDCALPQVVRRIEHALATTVSSTSSSMESWAAAETTTSIRSTLDWSKKGLHKKLHKASVNRALATAVQWTETMLKSSKKSNGRQEHG